MEIAETTLEKQRKAGNSQSNSSSIKLPASIKSPKSTPRHQTSKLAICQQQMETIRLRIAARNQRQKLS